MELLISEIMVVSKFTVIMVMTRVVSMIPFRFTHNIPALLSVKLSHNENIIYCRFLRRAFSYFEEKSYALII